MPSEALPSQLPTRVLSLSKDFCASDWAKAQVAAKTTNTETTVRSDFIGNLLEVIFSYPGVWRSLSCTPFLQMFSSWPDWPARSCGTGPTRNPLPSAARDSIDTGGGAPGAAPGRDARAEAGAGASRSPGGKRETPARFSRPAEFPAAAGQARPGAWD